MRDLVLFDDTAVKAGHRPYRGGCALDICLSAEAGVRM